jgi:hypothetical protein
VITWSGHSLSIWWEEISVWTFLHRPPAIYSMKNQGMVTSELSSCTYIHAMWIGCSLHALIPRTYTLAPPSEHLKWLPRFSNLNFGGFGAGSSELRTVSGFTSGGYNPGRRSFRHPLHNMIFRFSHPLPPRALDSSP